jgi:hypothetical protein
MVDQTALVNVSKTFFTENRAQNLARLCEAPRERHVEKALLRTDTAPAAGQINVRICRAIALPVDLVPEEAPPAGRPANDRSARQDSPVPAGQTAPVGGAPGP